MDADEFIVNVIAKKSNRTIELSVPDDVFNQAERILLKNEQGVFCKTFPAEAFCSDLWISVKEDLPKIPHDAVWSHSVYAYDREREQVRACYNKNGEWEEYYRGIPLDMVTHWMPLPHDPKEVNND